jgi:hypothetical protein
MSIELELQDHGPLPASHTSSTISLLPISAWRVDQKGDNLGR